MKPTISEKEQEALMAKLLVKPENLHCADCRAKGPRWISLDFGVFICYICSGQHRNLGPHVTRVRSVKLDKWTEEMAYIMENIGNRVANDFYECRFTSCGGSRPNPEKVNEQEIRAFIGSKYIKKIWSRENDIPPVIRLMECGTVSTSNNVSDAPVPSKTKQQSNSNTNTNSNGMTSSNLNMELLSFDSPKRESPKKMEKPCEDLLSFEPTVQPPQIKNTSPSLPENKTNAWNNNNNKNGFTTDLLDFDAPKPTTNMTASTQLPTSFVTNQQMFSSIQTMTITPTPTLGTQQQGFGSGSTQQQQQQQQQPQVAKPSQSIMDLYGMHTTDHNAHAHGHGHGQQQQQQQNGGGKQQGFLQKGNYGALDAFGRGQHPHSMMPNHFVPAFNHTQPAQHPVTKITMGQLSSQGTNNNNSNNSKLDDVFDFSAMMK